MDKSSPCRFVDSWWVCFVPLLPPSRRVAWRYGQSSFLVWCETHASISAPRSGERIQTCPQKRGRHSEGNRGTQSSRDRVADGCGLGGKPLSSAGAGRPPQRRSSGRRSLRDPAFRGGGNHRGVVQRQPSVGSNTRCLHRGGLLWAFSVCAAGDPDCVCGLALPAPLQCVQQWPGWGGACSSVDLRQWHEPLGSRSPSPW